MLGVKCLSFFARLSKLGSANAKPVHKFMLAMKTPSLKAFKTAIGACVEASMVHLEAMARERCGVFLYGENNEALANDYITDAYWLYQDWGAHAKALQMLQQYELLKVNSFHVKFVSSFCTMYSRILFLYPEEFQEKECCECYFQWVCPGICVHDHLS